MLNGGKGHISANGHEWAENDVKRIKPSSHEPPLCMTGAITASIYKGLTSPLTRPVKIYSMYQPRILPKDNISVILVHNLPIHTQCPYCQYVDKGKTGP